MLRAPFPWFGGKSRAAPLVWERFGDVLNYIEPFAGGLGVLLGRPHEPRVETVNDKDAYLANFWRALQAAPDEVARYADCPVNEADLHARHRWLVETGAERVARVKREPDYYDAKVAGWWVWGLCLWIGPGWCAQLREQRPYIGSRGSGFGQGVHASLTREHPSDGLYGYMQALAVRLRRVRVCCGDWRRVLGTAVTTHIGVTGVLLDPPYSHAERDDALYNHDHKDISADVHAWALAHGDDSEFRIALCGYEGEHEMPASWTCVPWKGQGGYARTVRGKANRHRERLWFSPHCLQTELPLFTWRLDSAPE